MAAAAEQPGKVLTLSVAHLFNDWYMNYLPTLLPFLIAAGLGVTRGAFLISIFTLTSSVVQPLFGYLVDRKNQRWLVYAGTVWMAVLLALIGVVEYYPLMLFLAAAAGLGTAAFHPQASAMVTAVSGNRRGLFQSLFIAGGNVGWAFTPLMVVPFIQFYGLAYSPVFMLPGILVALMLWWAAPRSKGQPVKKPAAPLSLNLGPAFYDVTKIVLVVAVRSLAFFGLITFLPIYFMERGVTAVNGSYLIFTMLFAGALGGLVGGFLSDRVGRKKVIVTSLFLATPLFYLFLASHGILAYLSLALAGASLLASFSVTVVAAQEIMVNSNATASGLMLGFGIGIGGLGVGLMGILAGFLGTGWVISMLVWLPLLAGLMGLLVRERQQVAISKLT